MKIYELERIAEENYYEFRESLEYEAISLVRKISLDGLISNHISINLNAENQVFIENRHCEEKDLKVIKAAIELAETPPEDREKEEKDKENLPDWMTRWLGEPVRDCEVEVEE